MRTSIHVNPGMLTWAIKRAGFELKEFTDRIPKVGEWISGTTRPTVKQLEDFSKKVYLPFGYLLLPEPPRENLPIPFYRTLKSASTSKVSINVYDTILLIQQRQDWLKEYLIDNGFESLPFVGKFKHNDDVAAIVKDIRGVLGLDENWASHFSRWTDALNNLTDIIEDSGVIMVFNGIVDNNTRRSIKVEDCRGFVMVDDVAPFMFINNNDGKAAQMFTIAHELAHVWVGYSAGFDFRKLLPANDPIEVLCDRVAAEFLVPENSFKEVWRQIPSSRSIKDTARHFKVSEIVIARRALDMGKISKKQFLDFYDEYSKRQFKKKQSDGGNFYATTRKRLSVTFATHINNAVKSGKLSYRDAYKLTSLTGDTFQNFFDKNLK